MIYTEKISDDCCDLSLERIDKDNDMIHLVYNGSIISDSSYWIFYLLLPTVYNYHDRKLNDNDEKVIDELGGRFLLNELYNLGLLELLDKANKLDWNSCN
jgi:hypothetical protein